MNKTLSIVLIVVLLVVSLGAGYSAYYFYGQYQDLKKNPNSVVQEETKTLTDKIGLLMVLPKSETPTVATVLDIKKLKDQPFFKNAKNGDKVLVYMTAKKAILYRPADNKIIEVAPVFTGAASDATAPTAQVYILDASSTAKVANDAAEKIKANVPNTAISGQDTADQKNYTKTIVVDISGKFKTQVDQIVSALGAEIGTWPEAEVKPNADIAVIVVK
jgi:hypothetical protein